MKTSISLGGAAMLALVALAGAAEGRGLGGTTMPTHSMRSDVHLTPRSIGSPRTFSPDGKTFSPDGVTFSPDGLQVKADKGGTKWKKPLDSDGGGPDDPPPKKTGTTGTGGGTKPKPDYQGPKFGGYYGPYGKPHHPYYGPGNGGSTPSTCQTPPC